MPRAVWQKRWIKLYPTQCLDGSIRYELDPDERGVWYDLLNFTAICNMAGRICDRDERSFPNSFIANRLNISLELLERTLTKCEEQRRISIDGKGIKLINWKMYQSEYERQKPYRESKRERAAQWEKEGKCGLCGEEGHTKYICPSSKFGKVVQR